MLVTVHGFIESYASGIQDDHNHMQIRALPEHGAYLIAPLFSLVRYDQRVAYYGGHIHFAAGYKEHYCLEKEWIEEFETLLSKLYWSAAEVTLTWSRERFAWSSDYSVHDQRDMPNKILNRSRFESAWDLKEIPWDL